MLQSDGFNGKRGKGNYRWLQGEVLKFESHLVVACTVTMSSRGEETVTDDDEMRCHVWG